MYSSLILSAVEERRAAVAVLARRLPLQTEVFVGELRRAPPLPGARDQRGLQQVRLDHVLERVALLAHRGRDGVDADGAAFVHLDHRAEELAVLLVEAALVDLRELQRLLGNRQRQLALSLDGGVIARTSQEPVCDARRAAASSRQLPQ